MKALSVKPLALRPCVHHPRRYHSSLVSGAFFGAEQAEEQLARLNDLSAEKRRVEEGAEKLKADAEKASAGCSTSAACASMVYLRTAAQVSHGLDGKHPV